MSSSRGAKIFIGSECKDTEDLCISRESRYWDTDQENDYLQRVRERALLRAKEILVQAQEEAEDLRKKAYKQALAEYRQSLEDELKKEKQDLEGRFERIIQGLEEEKKQIFKAYKSDILELVRMAVQKVVTVCLKQDQEQILGNLLEESLELVDLKREIVVSVEPEDEDLMQSLLQSAAQRYPGLQNWQIQTVQQGKGKGVCIENKESRVDNRLDSRWKAVEEVLEQLAMNGKA